MATKPTPNSRFWKSAIVYVIWIALTVWLIRSMYAPPQARQVSYSDFLSEVNAGKIQQVSIGERNVVGLLKPEPKNKSKNEKDKNVSEKASAAETPKKIEASRVPGLDVAPLVQELQTKNIKYSGNMPSSSQWMDLLVFWGPMLLIFVLIGAFVWRMQKGRGGPMSFGKTRARMYDSTDRMQTRYSDVAGAEEAKMELREVVDFLSHPEKYQRLGGRTPKGVLLVGPPGTGKTLLAKAVAGEAAVPFFSISGSEFVEMFVGVGASRVRDLFQEAKRRAPSIIFIDELDAIGKSRGGPQSVPTNEEREQTLNQLLVEMDGFDTAKAVIIMAATNRPEVLDRALLRPGRFDRQVVLDRPDLKEREAILRVHARKLKIGADVDLKFVAAETPGMVGADLANIVNEAALNAARRDAEQIENRDFEQAVDRVTMGFEKKGRLISPDEKERVAYHEVGHTLVALTVPNADPVRRVSIVPRSIGSLGHTLQLPEHDRYLLTEPELEDRISVLLGGRVAEDIIYNGIVSTGANDDLERATMLSREMSTHYGMGKHLGSVTYGISHQSQFLKMPYAMEEKNYSERTAEAIDAEVRERIDGLYDRVKKILKQRRADLDVISSALMRQETLEAGEIQKLLATAHQQQADVPPQHEVSSTQA
ncbi:MAG: ATP-dependent zinc metalloprotease FtsH [Candidatus Acidiferrales bacterium]